MEDLHLGANYRGLIIAKSSALGGIAKVLGACPNLVFLSLDLCSYLEQASTSPSFNKILRETHFSQIERLEVRFDNCGNMDELNLSLSLASSLIYLFLAR